MSALRETMRQDAGIARIFEDLLWCWAVVLAWDDTPRDVWLSDKTDAEVIMGRSVTVRGSYSVPTMVPHVRVSLDGDPNLGLEKYDEDFYLRPFVVHREDGENVFWLLLSAPGRPWPPPHAHVVSEDQAQWSNPSSRLEAVHLANKCTEQGRGAKKKPKIVYRVCIRGCGGLDAQGCYVVAAVVRSPCI